MPNNISSLINPSLINNAKSQLASQATNKVKTTILSRVDELKNQLEELIKKRTAIEKDYSAKNQKLQADFSSGAITEEEKNQKYNQFEKQKQDELKLLDEEIQKIKDSIVNSLNDPLKEAKKQQQKVNNNINNNIKSSERANVLANISRNNQSVQEIVPIILTQVSNILVKVASQNARLQELVNKTNIIIDSANTPSTINQALVLRNNALAIINNQEKKIIKVQNIVGVLSTILTIVGLIITIIKIVFSIPPPFGPGPFIPPIIAEKLNKAQKILDYIKVGIPICNGVLNQCILILENLKAQLRNINDLLDIKSSTNLSNTQLGSLLNNNINTNNVEGIKLGILPEIYKNFKFAIREETGIKALVVRGNKRHYAVAIDTNNVEVLKSELSFTLDPNDLIDQLKLIIDSQNLIA
jgi:hypothetical protein